MGAALNARPANRTGLPDRLKAGVEALSGVSMDRVKVHYNSARPAQFSARAYAQGTDIHLAPGQERHLPHEAWHVAQQAQSRVRPTARVAGGLPINDDAGLEREADIMGARALSHGGPVAGANARAALEPGGAPVAQLKYTLKDSIIGDIFHKEWKTLFSAETVAVYKTARYLKQGARKAVSDILDGREEGERISYKLAEGAEILASPEEIRPMIGRKEIMYVHAGDNIHVAGRDEEKKPHPSLVGGDPDVTAAGTLSARLNAQGWVLVGKITDDSGHFRVGEVPEETVALVKSKLAATEPAEEEVVGAREESANNQPGGGEEAGEWQLATNMKKKLHKKK
jgi:hypothetical protein